MEFLNCKLALLSDGEKVSAGERGTFYKPIKGFSIIVVISGGFFGGCVIAPTLGRYVTHGTGFGIKSIFERYLVTGRILWNRPEHPCTFSWRDRVITILYYRWLSSYTSQSCFAMQGSGAESSCDRAAKRAKPTKRCEGVFT